MMQLVQSRKRRRKKEAARDFIQTEMEAEAAEVWSVFYMEAVTVASTCSLGTTFTKQQQHKACEAVLVELKKI